MKANILTIKTILACLLIAPVLCYAGQKPVVCERQSQSLEKEINKNSLLVYNCNPENQVFYILSNDDTNLYINIRIPEGISQMKIIRFGLTIWIDADAKMHQSLGIKFPVGVTREQWAADRKRELTEDDKQLELVIEIQNIELIGFQGEGSRMIIPSDKQNNINGKIDFDINRNLIYKLIIPITKITTVKALKADGVFSIGFESGHDDIDKNQESKSEKGMGFDNDYDRENRMEGGHHQEGMGGRENDMGGNEMQNPQPDRQNISTPIKFWIKKVMLSKP
jgi:hypothetical protein